MENSSMMGYLLISVIIFGTVALIHLVRAINTWAFVMGPVDIPVVASWVGFVVTAALCGWGIRLLIS